jgi:hypothetical protein
VLTLSARVRVECHRSYTTIVTPFEIAFNVDSAYPTTMYFLQQIVRPHADTPSTPCPRRVVPAGRASTSASSAAAGCVCLSPPVPRRSVARLRGHTHTPRTPRSARRVRKGLLRCIAALRCAALCRVAIRSAAMQCVVLRCNGVPAGAVLHRLTSGLEWICS